MTLKQLEQYRDLSKEVKMLERRIADLDFLFQRIYEDVCCKG